MRPGPKPPDLDSLLFYELAWTRVFLGLRDGSPATEEQVPGGDGSGMLVKFSGQDEEKLLILRSGKKPLQLRVLKEVATDDKWRGRVQKEEGEFEALITGQKVERVRYPGMPAERNLWEALKRARSAAQVRRICRRSKHWLKWEWKGKRGGKRWYIRSPSACPEALSDHAEEFCRAKGNSRYPRSKRSSSDDRRIEYLARVMAGLSLVKPIAPATAVDLLRKMKHGRRCACWHCQVRRLSQASRGRPRSVLRR
jgi:hypothetical protein